MSRFKILPYCIVVITACLIVSACSKNPSTPPVATTSSAPATAEPVAFVNQEGKLLCPVLGNTIASKEVATGYSDYKGTRYYFCCAGCKPDFDANPAKYVKK